MDCMEARELLVDAAEDALPRPQREALDSHLGACAACRTQYELLSAGAASLRAALSELAPAEVYLTARRRKRLLEAAQAPKLFRLLTYRQFVGAAAAAAILVSAVFIGLDVARMRSEPAVTRPAQPPVAQALAPYVPVVLAAAGQGGPILVRNVSMEAEAPLVWEETGPGLLRVTADSPGLRVPVHHAFYDPDEASRWW